MQNPYHMLKKIAPHCITKIIVEAADTSNMTQLSLVNCASYDALFTLPVSAYSPSNPGKLYFLRGKKCLADYQYTVNENSLTAYWFFLQAYNQGYADCELVLDNLEELITINMGMPSEASTYFMRTLEALISTMLKEPLSATKTKAFLHYLGGTMAFCYCLMLKAQLQQPRLNSIAIEQARKDIQLYTCQAETYLNMAMSQGFAKAPYRLHELYINFNELEKARQLVTYLLTRTEQPETCYYLGEIYWQKWTNMSEHAVGPELANNLAGAMVHFAKAAAAGHLGAQTKIILFAIGFTDCLEEPVYQPIANEIQGYISNYQDYQLHLQQCCTQGHVKSQYEQALIELYGNTFTDATSWQHVIDGLMPLAQKNHLGALQQLMQLTQQNAVIIQPYINQPIHQIYEFCLSKLAKNGLFYYQFELAEKLANQQFNNFNLLADEQQSASFWQHKAIFATQDTSSTELTLNHYQPN